MKFNYSIEAADIIADELLNTLPILPEGALIVGVPTITNHVRQRGFDHIQRICKRISSKSGNQYLSTLARQNQIAQVGTGRKARTSQQQQAFRVRKPETVKNKHILLIDDVITTGATLESAAIQLKASGAKSVSALVFARSVI